MVVYSIIVLVMPKVTGDYQMLVVIIHSSTEVLLVTELDSDHSSQ